MATPGLLALVRLDEVLATAEPTGASWLNGSEAQRLNVMSSALRRRQFLAGHWLARTLAADAFGGEPGQWSFDTGADPRPRLSRAGNVVWTSISHSGDRVAAAVAQQPVGLDLEIPGRQRDLVALANFLFSPDEAAHVAQASDDETRSGIFYMYWTLKEARGKRGGEGLQPSQARRVSAVSCDEAAAEAMHWRLPSGGALSLAAQPGVRMEIRGFEHDTSTTLWRYVAVG